MTIVSHGVVFLLLASIHTAESMITDSSHSFLSQVQLEERIISLSRFLKKEFGVCWGQESTWDHSAWARGGQVMSAWLLGSSPVGQMRAAARRKLVSWEGSAPDVHTVYVPFHRRASSSMSFYVSHHVCVSV